MARTVPQTGSSRQQSAAFPRSGLTGYLLSLMLTAVAFLAVHGHVLKPGPLFIVILLLAVAQIVLQLLFFMHVNERYGPRYHILLFALAMFFVFVFVGASIWIMTFSAPVS